MGEVSTTTWTMVLTRPGSRDLSCLLLVDLVKKEEGRLAKEPQKSLPRLRASSIKP